MFRNNIKIVLNIKNCLRYCTKTTNNEVIINFLKQSDEGLVVIGLNRNKNYNAFSQQLLNSLSDAFNTLKYDTNIRAVVLRSLVPGVFSAGADLKERTKFTEQDVKNFTNKFRALNLSIENFPVPVIAAVNGTALGGGLEMALACDIRIVSATAKLGLVETKLSILPGAGGTQRLPRLINPSIAKELIYTARVFSGVEAKDYGIANHVVDENKEKDAAFEKSLEIAREILKNGPLGVRMAKKAINKGLQVDIVTGCDIEEACYAQLIPTKDRKEALLAFAEKRKPNFQGI